MLHLNRLWLMLGFAATMSSLFAADPIAVWTNFTGLTATSPLAPTFSSPQNGLNGADWRFNLEGATVTADGALQTGVAAPAKITFAASGTPTIDIGTASKPITVLIALKGLTTSTTKGKPFWIATNGTQGIGCALNDYAATTAKTKGCWDNSVWSDNRGLKDMNGLAGDGTKCLAMFTGNSSSFSTITTVTATTLSWLEMNRLRGDRRNVDGIYFGNFRGGRSGGMNYTLVGVAVFNGKATDAELKAIVGSPIWQGTASGSGTWNTVATNKAWASAFTKEAEAFVNNTPAIFNDISGATTSTVTVGGTVTPAFTVVGNSATTYTFIGNGTVAGSLITKQGNGTVEIACANRASELRVGGGTVKLNHASALNAAGTLTMAGGTLDLNGTSRTTKTLIGTAGTITSTSAATLTVTDPTTYGGNIGGAVSLALAANSSLSGAITTTGTITVTSGKLKRSGIQPMTINALPAGGIEFDGASWVDLYTEAPNTEHTLITVTTASANWDNVTAINVPPFIDFIKSGTTCKIRIVELTWDSAKTTGIWNKTASSWSNSKTFADGNAVKFETLTGATAATVTVTEAVAPSALTVASNSYTFDGSAINAATVEVASGASAIFNAPLNVSGATTVNGTLTAVGATFTGSTMIAANGALTTTGASTFSTTPVVNGTLSIGANTTLPATLTTTTKSASGTFIQTAGTRSLTLSATAVRNYDVQGGTLTLDGSFVNANTEGNAPSFTVKKGAHLKLNGQDVIGFNQPNSTLVATVAGLLEKTGSHETFSGKMILEDGGELKNFAGSGGFRLFNGAIIEVATGATASITGSQIWVQNKPASLDVAANARLSVSVPLVFERNLTKNGAGTAEFSGAITGGQTLIIRGGTVILSGAAKECTHTEVSDATLKTSVAPGNNTLKLQAKSTLEPNGAALTLANAVTMEGAVTLNATQAITLNGAVTTTGAALAVKGASAVTVASLNVDATSSLDIAKGTSVTVTAATFASGATLKVRGGTLAVAAITLPPSGKITLEVPAGVIIPNSGVAILTSTNTLSDPLSKFEVPKEYVLKVSADNKTLELFNAITIARPDGDPSQFSDDATKQILASVSAFSSVRNITEVTVKTSHGTAVTTVDTVNAVLGCFEGVATATVNGTTATVAIVYDFGISALAPTVNDSTSATVTCQVQGANGAAATFADGVIVGLQTTEGTPATIEGVNEVNRTGGTVILTVPLANIQNKAFRAVATKPDPAP